MRFNFRKFILLLSFSAVVLSIAATSVIAAEPYKYLVPFTSDASVSFDGSTAPIAKYIKTIYTYALSIVGILSTIVMMFAGFLWITSGGNASRVQDAQAWIASAITGLVLALFSYTFLYLINPALVTFKPVTVISVGKSVVCCNTSSGVVQPENKTSADGKNLSFSCPSTSQECKDGKICSRSGPESPYVCSSSSGSAQTPITNANDCTKRSGIAHQGNDPAAYCPYDCSGPGSYTYEIFPYGGTTSGGICCFCINH